MTRSLSGIEPSGDIRIRHADLRATVVDSSEGPGAIDELPLVGLVATQADGVTEVRGASELRVKESDEQWLRPCCRKEPEWSCAAGTPFR